RTLASTHARFGGLLRQRTIREDVDPHLAAALDVPIDRDTGGFDLAVGHVAVLQRLDAVLAEVNLGAALGEALPLRRVALPPLHLAWDEHVSALRLLIGLWLSDLRSAGGSRFTRSTCLLRARKSGVE